MVLKPEQERVRTLLVDTITLLCRNGLNYKTEFNINALIGITLDNEDIFLVDIRETIKNAASEQNQSEAAADASDKRGSRSESTSSKSRKRRKDSHRGGEGETSESEIEADSSSRKASSKHNAEARTNAESADAEPPSKRSIKQELFENAQSEVSEENRRIIVKPEPGYRQRACDTTNNDNAANTAAATTSMAGPSWDTGQLNFNSSAPTQGNHPSQTQQADIPWDSLMNASTTPVFPEPERIGASSARSSPIDMLLSLPDPATFQADFSAGALNEQYPIDSNLLYNTSSAGSSSRFQCPQCVKCLRTKQGLQMHLNQHRGKYRYRCSVCNKGLSSSTTLKEHTASEHTLQPCFACPDCAELFWRQKHLKKHRQLGCASGGGVASAGAAGETLDVTPPAGPAPDVEIKEEETENGKLQEPVV